jgi:hypothetical protein
MYEKNGIYYAGEPGNHKQLIAVRGVRPLDDYKLWLRFSTNEEKIYDVAPLLDSPVFRPLKDKAVFNSVYLDYATVVWNNGEIDIDPECLYENSAAVPKMKAIA